MSFVSLAKYLDTSYRACIPARKAGCNSESIRLACEALPANWSSLFAQYIEQNALRKRRITSLHIVHLIAMHTDDAAFSVVAAHIRSLLQSIWVIIDSANKEEALSSVCSNQDTLVHIATEISEGLSLCSAGLYERLYLLYQEIIGEPSIEEYLFRYRLEIVTHVAHQYFAIDKIDEMLEVHERERYLQAAEALGLGLQASAIDSRTFAKKHRVRVLEAMRERYTPIQMIHFIETQLYDSLRLQGYHGVLDNEHGYCSGDYQRWQKTIEMICESVVPAAQIVIQNTITDAVSDINRPNLLQLIKISLVNKRILVESVRNLDMSDLITNQRDRLLWSAEYANFDKYSHEMQTLPLTLQKSMLQRTIRIRFYQSEPVSRREIIDQFYDETIEKLYEAGELYLPKDSDLLLLHRRFALGPDPSFYSYRKPYLKIADIIILLNHSRHHFFLIQNLLTTMLKYPAHKKLELIEALCDNIDKHDGGALVNIQRSPVLINVLLKLISSCDKETQLKIITYVNKNSIGLIAASMLHVEKKSVWFTEKLIDCLCEQDRTKIVQFLQASMESHFNLFSMIFTYDAALYQRLHDYFSLAKQQVALARFIECLLKSTSYWYGAWFHERGKEKALEQYHRTVAQCHMLSVDEMRVILLAVLTQCSVVRSSNSEINKADYPKSFSMACYLLGENQFAPVYSLLYGNGQQNKVEESVLLDEISTAKIITDPADNKRFLLPHPRVSLIQAL